SDGFVFFFSSRRRHTRFSRDWSSDVCSSDLLQVFLALLLAQLFLGERELGGALVAVHSETHQRMAGVEQQFDGFLAIALFALARSEERRVGKECRARWAQ